jgi:teichoic acid transport system permease protein
VAGDAIAEPARRQLAATHGLTRAGRRPSVFEYVHSLWRYRHFITAYADGRMVAQFSTARLGRLWQVLNPLINAAVYYLIFGVVLNQRGGHNYIAYLCAGLFLFTFTQTVLLSSTQAISGNLGLIRALHFPRASLPVAVSLMQVQNLAASVAVLAGIILATGEPLSPRWLLIGPALALQTLFSVGLGMILARLGARLDDLKQVMPFVLRTWMYGSGVMYSINLFKEHLPGWLSNVLLANPMLVYIELGRYALIDSTRLVVPISRLWLLGTVWTLLLAVGGFVYFWRGEQEYGRG